MEEYAGGAMEDFERNDSMDDERFDIESQGSTQSSDGEWSTDEEASDSFGEEDGGYDALHPAQMVDDEESDDAGENVPLPPGWCCLFSEPVENFRFICTFGGLSILMSFVSAFAFLLVSKEEKEIKISYFYVWLPMLVLASLLCCAATLFACCMLAETDDDEDEQEATRRRDKTSAVCVLIFCVVVPLFITIQFGMSFSVVYSTPVLLFIPQMLFPTLLLLGLTLVLCFSDLDGVDRLITAVVWLFVLAWVLTIMFIPLKMMHSITWSWWKTVAPTYLLDLFIFFCEHWRHEESPKRWQRAPLRKLFVPFPVLVGTVCHKNCWDSRGCPAYVHICTHFRHRSSLYFACSTHLPCPNLLPAAVLQAAED